MCYQLTFFCEKLQQVKSLSQTHLTKASLSLLLEAERQTFTFFAIQTSNFHMYFVCPSASSC